MWDFFNNASVSAFVGAFAAFLLVALTDIRRAHRKKRTMKDLICDLGDLAQKKIETCRTNLAMIQEDNKFTTAPVMQFPTAPIKHIQLDVLYLLNANEKAGLDGILYWADAIDGLFAEALATSERLRALAKKEAPTSLRAQLGEDIIESFRNAERNLEYLVELCG